MEVFNVSDNAIGYRYW